MYIKSALGLSAGEYGIWAIFNWLMPLVTIACAFTGVTLKDLDNKPYKKSKAKAGQ